VKTVCPSACILEPLSSQNHCYGNPDRFFPIASPVFAITAIAEIIRFQLSRTSFNTSPVHTQALKGKPEQPQQLFLELGSRKKYHSRLSYFGSLGEDQIRFGFD